MVRRIFYVGICLIVAFLLYSSLPVCNLERAYVECAHDPHSGEPCDTWINTNYAGLDNGGLTEDQCQLASSLSKAKLEQLLKQSNKDRVGRSIKADDIIWCALALINDAHIAEIRDKALSNKDRMELLFQNFVKERRGATREEFLGALLAGELTH